MKTLYLLFIMGISAALMRGVCYADSDAPASQQSQSESSDATAGINPNDAKHTASVDDGKHQTKGEPSDGKLDDRRASDKKGPGGQVGTAKAEAQQALNRQERLEEIPANHNLPGNTFGNTMNLHQPARSAQTVNGGMLKMDDNSHSPARSTALVPLGGTSFNNVRNRSSVPAVIGGAANSFKSTAAINGTDIYYKP
ncbi:MAG TPA: hypothetical protein VMA13_07845 [Candidatus Saccharimonadales bacterium]|nr:hypothetical protein [Candidatus Saccharimonadales bacterium]